MLKHLHIKILSLILAMLLWVFVVSLENAFFELPEPIPIEVFNLSPELALATRLPAVRLTVRAPDPVALRRLSPSDFEAYVDLRNIGAGQRQVTVLVTAKNPQISLVKADPSQLTITIEPVRQKLVTLLLEVKGQPAKDFRVDGVKLSSETATVKGASGLLSKIGSAKATIELDGSETADVTKKAAVKIYDAAGIELEDLKAAEEISGRVTIVEVSPSKQLGVKASVRGSIANGVVRSIEVSPAVVSVKGPREVLRGLEVLETEVVDVSAATESFEKRVRVVLPAGVVLEKGEKAEVLVKVEIEKQLPLPKP